MKIYLYVSTDKSSFRVQIKKIMKHPILACQIEQEEFLKKCSESERDYFARNFRIGNAAYIYHQQAFSEKEEWLRIYYKEWLEGLPANLAVAMKKRGFDGCKSILPFLRYVNERKDSGLRDWMKEHLSDEDYMVYQKSAGEDQ